MMTNAKKECTNIFKDNLRALFCRSSLILCICMGHTCDPFFNPFVIRVLVKLFVSRFCIDRQHNITSDWTFLREHDVRTCLPFGNCRLTHELLFLFNSYERVSYIRPVRHRIVSYRCSAQNCTLRDAYECISRYRMIFGLVWMYVYRDTIEATVQLLSMRMCEFFDTMEGIYTNAQSRLWGALARTFFLPYVTIQV